MAERKDSEMMKEKHPFLKQRAVKQLRNAAENMHKYSDHELSETRRLSLPEYKTAQVIHALATQIEYGARYNLPLLRRIEELMSLSKDSPGSRAQ